MSQQTKSSAPGDATTANAARPSTQQRRSMFAVERSWIVGLMVAMVMILLALLGVGLTTANAAVAPTYWISLVPVFGLLCVFTAYARAGISGINARSAVIRQVLHWLGIAVALMLDFYIRGTGQENGVAAGLNALLLLALGCYLAGVHLEWPFAIVGVLLTATLVCVAEADEYLWLILLIGAAALVAMAFMAKLLSGARSTDAPPA